MNMKLLLTGAFKYSKAQLQAFRDLGAELVFQNDERGNPETDFSLVDAVVCNGLFLYHSLQEFPNLRFVQLTSAGLDRVPTEDFRKKGIILCNARGVYSVPMAEWAMCGVLSLYKHLNFFLKNQKIHMWEKDRTVRELYGDTALIVGCGSVGTECAKRFKAMGMHIAAADVKEPSGDEYGEYFPMSELDKALETADVVILTLPLTEETRQMFNKQRFSHCKKGAIIVNISRGAVVNEKDLTAAVKCGQIGGAVLDVFEEEPLSPESPLWDMENVIITPHNSFIGNGNSQRLMEKFLENISEFARSVIT